MTAWNCTAVDIVVNNHNYARFVAQAVESALGQRYPGVSVIVIDDGSSDNSREVLEPYRDVVDLVFKECGGQASALNAGFDRCRGEVVIFLDADDTLTPQAAGLAAEAFGRNPEAARLQFRTCQVDETGREMGSAPGSAAGPPASGDLRQAELSSPFEMATVPTSANAFRTSVLRKIMPIPAKDYGRWGADYYLVHLSTLLGGVIFLPDTATRYRVHGHNAFQPSRPEMDLDRIRMEIRYQQITMGHLSRLAAQLRLDPPEPILSMSNLTLRAISLRLDPRGHPLPGDSLPVLIASAIRASARRPEVPALRRLVQVAAVAALGLAPSRLATRLAEMIVFPELRGRWAAWPNRASSNLATVRS
jgi:hypothetical protein